MDTECPHVIQQHTQLKCDWSHRQDDPSDFETAYVMLPRLNSQQHPSFLCDYAQRLSEIKYINLLTYCVAYSKHQTNISYYKYERDTFKRLDGKKRVKK